MFILAYCLFHIIILVLLDDYKDSNFDSNYVLMNIEMVLMGSMWVLIWIRSKNESIREDVSAKELAQQDGLNEPLIDQDEENLQAPAPRPGVYNWPLTSMWSFSRQFEDILDVNCNPSRH